MENEDYTPKGNQLNAHDYEDRAFETPYAGAPTAEKPAEPTSPEAKLGSTGLRRIGEAAAVQFQVMRQVGMKNYLSDPLLSAKESVQDSITTTAENIAAKTVKSVEKTRSKIEAAPGNAAKRYREGLTRFGDFLNKPVQEHIKKAEIAKRRKALRLAKRDAVMKQRVGQIKSNSSRRTQNA